VTEPRQPAEVAALAAELDGMLARLGRSAEEREAALQAARRFAADAGHELRTPLQSVRSNLEIARREGVLPDQLRIALDTATSQSDRLNQLVDGLQGLARGEAGLEPTAGDVDLGDVADGAVFAARTRHPELSVELDVPDSGPVVTGDTDGLWRVVENLVENAARYGRDGGRVRVRVAALDGGGEAEIVVDDDGAGIPAGERERVLRRFARGAATNGIAGNGLGLSIVQAEAHRHGGDLTLGVSDLGGLRARVTVGGRKMRDGPS
jgi:two-component system sensor histidine kinase PrrB